MLSISVTLHLPASCRLTLEERTMEGETLLTLAAKAGLVENVKMLVEHGACPNNTSAKNESPLVLGVYQHRYLCLSQVFDRSKRNEDTMK